MRDPWHREIRRILAEYKISPAPLIVDVDQRDDRDIFIPVLQRLLDTTTLPQLLLNGRSLGTYRDIREMREDGTLKETLEAGGVAVTRRKAKAKRPKEKERLENERVLGPAPVVEV